MHDCYGNHVCHISDASVPGRTPRVSSGACFPIYIFFFRLASRHLLTAAVLKKLSLCPKVLSRELAIAKVSAHLGVLHRQGSGISAPVGCRPTRLRVGISLHHSPKMQPMGAVFAVGGGVLRRSRPFLLCVLGIIAQCRSGMYTASMMFCRVLGSDA